MSQSRLAAQLKRLLPGQEYTRIRQGIMAAYINNTGSAALNSNQHNHEIGQIYGLPEELESFVKTDGSRDLTAPLVSPNALTDDQLINLGQSKGLFYTKTQMDDFFSGTTPKLGYNKNNWDTAYTRSITGGNFNETTGNLSFTRQGLSGLTINLDGRYIRESKKGIVNGVATLDLNGKVPLSQINDALLGNVSYQGQWNANTNTPALPDPTTVKGHYYVTQTAGTYNGTYYEVGDWAIADGVIWDVVRNTDAVASVFGRTGVITAQSADYAAFYEPVFTKNTAFNKNFGTSAGTVAQGDDSRINNGQTAFGWGDHALAGYLTSSDLSGYATESWVNSGFVSKSGDTMSGELTVTESGIGSSKLSGYGVTFHRNNSYLWPDENNLRSLHIGGSTKGNTDWVNINFYGTGVFRYNDNNIALQSWVQSQGYLTSSDLSGYATESWVSSNYEPLFSKNTAFNKNFGTSAGTVAEGNDSRILNGQTAFGWGDHALAGYLTSSDLSGYATESWVNSGFVSKSGDTMSGELTVTESGIGSSKLSGYGVTFHRNNSYLWPDENNLRSLHIGGSTKGNTDWVNINFYGTGVFRYNDNNIALQSWVQSQGYLTSSDLSGYATESWVSSNYEPLFSKNTAFNKNFGTSAGTVAEGNDSRILNGQTAFGWGDHALAGYLTSSDLSGYATESWVQSNYSPIGHTHTWSSLTGNVQTIPGAGAQTNHGSLSISGSKNGYAGINFTDGNYTLMVRSSDGLNGIYDHTTNSWRWGFDTNGALAYGSIPWARVTGAPDFLTSSDLSGYATESWVSSNYEPLFSKNTAFNKNFGTSAGTVAEGNDSRILNGQTAFGWGDHALAGYLTSSDLSGYATESWVNSGFVSKSGDTMSGELTVTESGIGSSKLSGYGVTFHRNNSYLWPDENNLRSLHIGGSTKGNTDWVNINFYGTGVFRYNDNNIALQSWVQSQDYAVSGTGSNQVRSNTQLDSRYSQVAHNHDSRYGRVDQSADTITNFWRGTQAQWDALGTKPSIAFIKD